MGGGNLMFGAAPVLQREKEYDCEDQRRHDNGHSGEIEVKIVDATGDRRGQLQEREVTALLSAGLPRSESVPPLDQHEYQRLPKASTVAEPRHFGDVLNYRAVPAGHRIVVVAEEQDLSRPGHRSYFARPPPVPGGNPGACTRYRKKYRAIFPSGVKTMMALAWAKLFRNRNRTYSGQPGGVGQIFDGVCLAGEKCQPSAAPLRLYFST